MVVKRAAKKFLSDIKTKRAPVKERLAAKQLNGNDIENIVREHAYRLYEQRGCTHGADLNDWLEAERIIKRS